MSGNGRYIPPSLRDPAQGSTDIRLTQGFPSRSLEELSSNQPRDSDRDSEHQRGRGRGYGRDRGRGRGRGSFFNNRGNQRRQPRYGDMRPRKDGEFTLQEIRKHFWIGEQRESGAGDAMSFSSEKDTAVDTESQVSPTQDVTTDVEPQLSPGLDTTNNVKSRPSSQLSQQRDQSTLNNSWKHKNALSYLLLFPNAHPRWESDGIIFAHTNIDLLPGYDEEFKGAEDAEEGFQAVSAQDDGRDAETVEDAAAPAKSMETPQGATEVAHILDAQDKQISLEAAMAAISINITNNGQTASENTTDAVFARDNHEEQTSIDTAAGTGPTENINGEQASLRTDIDAIPAKDAKSIVRPPDPADLLAEIACDEGIREEISRNAKLELSTPLLSHPLAVFQQFYGTHSTKTACFRFAGWYDLHKVDFLRPRTEELARMMEQKWDIKDAIGREVQRNKSAWEKSMSMRWAVCMFRRSEEQVDAPSIQIRKEKGFDKWRKEAEKEVKGDNGEIEQGDDIQGNQEEIQQSIDQGNQDEKDGTQGTQVSKDEAKDESQVKRVITTHSWTWQVDN